MSGDMISVKNKLTGAVKQVSAAELAVFLRKHTLYEQLRAPSPVRQVAKRPAAKKPTPKAAASKPKPKRSADSDTSSVKRTKKESSSDADDTAALSSVELNSPSNIILSLEELAEITDKYASMATQPDWTELASSVCNGRFTADEVEIIATEYQANVHFRPSIGMIVIPPTARSSEYRRHQMVISKIQGVAGEVVKAFKEIKQGGSKVAATTDGLNPLKTEAAMRADAALARIHSGEAEARFGRPMMMPPPQPAMHARMPYQPGMPMMLPQPGSSMFEFMRRPGPGRPRKTPMPPLLPASGQPQSGEIDFVRDLLLSGDEWLQVVSSVVTRDSISALVLKAAQTVLIGKGQTAQ